MSTEDNKTTLKPKFDRRPHVPISDKTIGEVQREIEERMPTENPNSPNPK